MVAWVARESREHATHPLQGNQRNHHMLQFWTLTKTILLVLPLLVFHCCILKKKLKSYSVRGDLGTRAGCGGNGGSGGLAGHVSVVNIIATKQKPNFQTINNAAKPGKAGVKGNFGYNGKRGDKLIIKYEIYSTSLYGICVGDKEKFGYEYVPDDI